MAPAQGGHRGVLRGQGPVSRADASSRRRSPACSSSACPLHEDARGWFKENWQRAKMTALGLPDFGPVQHNVAFNARRGVDPRRAHRAVGQVHQRRAGPDLRRLGRHARGRQLRPGVHDRGGPVGRGVRAPRGRQLLPGARGRHDVLLPGQRPLAARARLPGPEPGRPHRCDPVADPPGRGGDLGEGPDHADARRRHADAAAQDAHRRQPGPARHARCRPTSPAPTSSTSTSSTSPIPTRWRRGPGTSTAWCSTPRRTPRSTRPRPRTGGVRRGRRTPAARPPSPGSRPSTGSRWCTTRPSTSSTAPLDPHVEDEPLSPLGVYAQTKAAGDVAVATAPRHYVLRTSWVIGAGKNFVRTMQQLAADGVSPKVVDDQVGRLTFTEELSRATRHLLDVRRAVRHLQREQRR